MVSVLGMAVHLLMRTMEMTQSSLLLKKLLPSTTLPFPHSPHSSFRLILSRKPCTTQPRSPRWVMPPPLTSSLKPRSNPYFSTITQCCNFLFMFLSLPMSSFRQETSFFLFIFISPMTTILLNSQLAHNKCFLRNE